jgi:Fe2+ or Zn2+ uptake regulation protein
MNQTNLTSNQITVLKVLRNEHLTSFQILKKVDNISLILVLYTVMDELKGMGILKSYTKKKNKFHYTC